MRKISTDTLLSSMQQQQQQSQTLSSSSSSSAAGKAVKQIKIKINPNSVNNIPSRPRPSKDKSSIPAYVVNSDDDKVLIGIIVTIKDTYGFVQPLGAGSNVHLFFSLRESYPECMIGDTVKYVARQKAKGLQADRVTKFVIDSSSAKYVEGAKGVITKEYDAFRNIFGEIEMSSPAGATAIYALDKTDNSKKIFKGDEIECTLIQFIDMSGHGMATDVKVTRTKKDKIQLDQIQRMFDAGGIRIKGIIQSLIDKEKDFPYGFIKSTDRTDHVYFRLDDFRPAEQAEVSAGTEVEFFVIAENNKGKLSDRAVHLSILPKGSVVFEVTLGENLKCVVVTPPSMHPKESPGLVRLVDPVRNNALSGTGAEAEIYEVQLWERCLRPGTILKPGDLLDIKVQYYVPEKLVFARDVDVLEYRKIGRETGHVCMIKNQGTTYGFITCDFRNADVYFRLSDVLDCSCNKFLDESDVKANMTVSFDVTIEESSNKPPMLRAVRVRKLKDMNHTKASVVKVQEHCRGYLSKIAKKDGPGTIVIPTTEVDAASLEMINSNAVIDVSMHDFNSNPFINRVTFDSLTPLQRDAYCRVIGSKYSDLFCYDIPASKYSDAGVDLGRPFRIWKRDQSSASDSTSAAAATTAVAQIDENSNADGHKKKTEKASNELVVHFNLCSFSDRMGVMAKNLDVEFELYYDTECNKLFAEKVQLTDEEIVTNYCQTYNTDKVYGVLDTVISKGGKFGYIRAIPTDEKVFWHSTGVGQNVSLQELEEGKMVSFEFRRRGGLRCANKICIIDYPVVGFNSTVVASNDVCTGMITAVAGPNNSEVKAFVMINASKSACFSKKFVDFKHIKEYIAPEKKTHGYKNTHAAPEPSDCLAWRSNGDDSAAAATATGGGGGGEAAIVDDCRYMPMLNRSPIPINDASHDLCIGDVVTVNPVVLWARSRSPVDIKVTSKSSEKLVKKLGVIVRSKVSAKIDSSTVIEMVEILGIDDGSSSSTPDDSHLYYCDHKELSLSSNCQGGEFCIDYGVEVEFYAVKELHLALLVVVQPTRREVGNINFRRNPINAQLRDKARFKGVSMAEGPPDSDSIGFVAGWRKAPSAALPWAHLLSYQ